MKFWKKLGVTAAIALVFGLVAGLCFSGVTYLTSRRTNEPKHITRLEDIGNEQKDKDKDEQPPEKADSEVKSGGNTTQLISTGSVSDIAAEVMPSVVAITNISIVEYRSMWYGSQKYKNTSAGSGTIVSEDDNFIYIVTNNHVVSGANTLTVTFVDDEICEADVLGASPTLDIAVVTVSKSDMVRSTKDAVKVAKLGDSDSILVGQDCIAIGNAMAYGQSVTKGIISAIGREVTVQDPSTGEPIKNKLIQTDAAINPGNSGGALLDASGVVIGINSVKFSDTSVEGMGYAIPINDIKPIINKFITQEKTAEGEEAFLGISGIEVSNSANSDYGIPHGLCITKVGEGSAAEKAGLEAGDIIIKFNGRSISTMEEISEEMEYLAAGSTVEVTVAKKADGYTESVISVTLGKREPVNIADISEDKNTEEENTPEDNSGDGSSDFYWPFSFFGF